MIIEFFSMAPTWEILSESGGSALAFDTFLGMEFKNENGVSFEPIENGSFATYNKQHSPHEIRVTLASMLPYMAQQAILSTLDELADGTDLVSLVTPASEYKDLNITAYSYRRDDSGGAGMLVVEITLTEVRQVETAARTETTEKGTTISKGNAKNKSDVSTQHTGKTQGRQWKPYNSVLSGKGNAA